jgi:hypothetical protein
LSSPPEVHRLLAQGVEFAQAGQRLQAYKSLLNVVELDQRNELAWLWLSTVTDNIDDQLICLENVLTINPSNSLARQRLAALSDNGTQPGRTLSITANVATTPPPPAPLTLWPVVAFWVSVSILFLGGGVASVVDFAFILLRARGIVQNLSLIEMAWLPMGLFFVVFGLTGISLAWQLARRRPGGYCGSLIFGLALTVLGPSTSLILDPPNYQATVCTGLMPAAAVLLTIASLAGFESRTKKL